MRDQQEFKPGEEWDMPILNVFRRDGGTIRHFWGSELLYVPPEPGQEYRHNDLLDPLWNMLDVTPEGRGDFHPRLEYRLTLFDRERHDADRVARAAFDDAVGIDEVDQRPALGVPEARRPGSS